MADKPLSDERLAEIREYAFREPPATLKYAIMNSTAAPLMVFINMAWSQRHELLAEVDRLRAREAAAMAIVRAVAQNDMVMPLRDSVQCVFWDCEYDYISDHSSNCPVTKARALLADEGH